MQVCRDTRLLSILRQGSNDYVVVTPLLETWQRFRRSTCVCDCNEAADVEQTQRSTAACCSNNLEGVWCHRRATSRQLWQLPYHALPKRGWRTHSSQSYHGAAQAGGARMLCSDAAWRATSGSMMSHRVHRAFTSLPITGAQVGVAAHVLFEKCWKKIMAKYGEKLRLPREIVWLNGAPGSGKGVNTPFIKKCRGLSRAVIVSSLLASDAGVKAAMDKGDLVPDETVGDILLDAIFNPKHCDGAGLLIDGFPRTSIQVDFLTLLYQQMMKMHAEMGDQDIDRFPKPSFKVVVLYVDEETSIARQLRRAQQANKHNIKFLDAGVAEKVRAARVTDADAAKCAVRYQVFKENYPALQKLSKVLPYSIIDATGTLQECEAQIAHELRYQSSMDLSEKTYRAIRHLPLATELVRYARQHLVQRLDLYCHKHYDLFEKVIAVIDGEVMPLLWKCSLAGHAVFVTTNSLFADDKQLASRMLVDICTDRGYSVSHVKEEIFIPVKVDKETGNILNKRQLRHTFRFTFERISVREALERAEESMLRAAEAAEKALISTSIVPEQFDYQVRYGERQIEDAMEKNNEASISKSSGMMRSSLLNNEPQLPPTAPSSQFARGVAMGAEACSVTPRHTQAVVCDEEMVFWPPPPLRTRASVESGTSGITHNDDAVILTSEDDLLSEHPPNFTPYSSGAS